MVKRTIVFFSLSLILFPLICYSQENSNAKESEYHKTRVAQLQLQKKQYEKIEKDLTKEQKEICLTFLHFREMQLADANEYEMINVCKKFQQLIVQEPKETKAINKCWYALRQINGPEQPLIYSCSRITEICRDSKTMPLDEKIVEIKRQGNISDDYRIREVAIDLLINNDKYEEAIDYCLNLISDIKESNKTNFLSQYQYYLIETRILYQRYLFREAVKEQKINLEVMFDKGPQIVKIDMVQYRIAKSEVEELINEKSQYVERCATLFSGDLIGELEEVKEFTDYLKLLVKSQI